MFHLLASTQSHNKQEKKQAHSSRYMQSQRFIPPTHPAYVITSLFQAPHIVRLQQEFDKNYIAMGMQTSKKKLMRIPDQPQDKFFIIVDDSMGPTLLQGEFLTLNSRVVRYPGENNIAEVIESFKKYIGLGHYETTEQYFQNNDEANLNENRQATMLVRNQILNNQHLQSQVQESISNLNVNLGRNGVISSVVSASHVSKIQLRQVSSLKMESKITKGKLFIYVNRKDNAEYTSLISQLRTRYLSTSSIRFIERIDEYNNQTRISKQYENIIFMSQYSYTNLSKYFLKFKSFALFTDQSQKMDIASQRKVAFATSRKDKIMSFVEMFIQNRSKMIENDEVGHHQKIKSQPLSEGKLKKQGIKNAISVDSPNNFTNRLLSKAEMKPQDIKYKQKPIIGIETSLIGGQNKSGIMLKSVTPIARQNNKSTIHLVRVTDLDKKALKNLKSKVATQPAEIDIKLKDKPIQKQKQGKGHPDLHLGNTHGQITKSPIITDIKPIKLKKQQTLHFKQLPKPTPQYQKAASSPFNELPKIAELPKEGKQLSMLIMGDNPSELSFENRSQHTKKSKIKKLKSQKKVTNNEEGVYPLHQDDLSKAQQGWGISGLIIHKPSQDGEKQEQKQTKRSPSLVVGHLRRGSDDHHRSQQRPSGHNRVYSDSANPYDLAPQINVHYVSSSKNSSQQQANQYYHKGVPHVPQIDANATHKVRQVKERRMSDKHQVSIKLPSSNKKKEEKQQAGPSQSMLPKVIQSSQQNIMTSFRKPTIKQQNGQKTPIGEAVVPVLVSVPMPEQEEKMMVRKPNPKHTLKHESTQKFKSQKKQELKKEEQQSYFVVQPKAEPNLQRLRDNNKVLHDEQYMIAKQNNSPNNHRRVMKAIIIPPSFQTINPSQLSLNPNSQIQTYMPKASPFPLYEDLSNAGQNLIDSNTSNQLQIPGISNISSIRSKPNTKTPHSGQKGKRFTFGNPDDDLNLIHHNRKPLQGKIKEKDNKEPPKNDIKPIEQQQNKHPSSGNLIFSSHFKPAIQQKLALRPSKSKSQSQVHRVFNKYRVKPEQQIINHEPKMSHPNDEMYSNKQGASTLRPRKSNLSNRSNRQNNPNVGKIYSQLKCNASKANIYDHDSNHKKNIDYPTHTSSNPPNALHNFDPKNHKQQSAIPLDIRRSITPNSYKYYKNKGIEDLIDLDKYDKVIQNGVTVYRSKFPILVTQYSPPKIKQNTHSQLQPQQNAYNNPTLTSRLPSPKDISNIKQQPYLLHHVQEERKNSQKENKLRRSKSGVATPLARFVPKITQQQPKLANMYPPKITGKENNHEQKVAKRKSNPIDTLDKPHHSQLNRIKYKLQAQKASPINSPTIKKSKSMINPIQQLLASKLQKSNNNHNPILIFDLQSPNMQKQQQFSKSQESFLHNDFPQQDQKLILYLIDKSHSNGLFEQLNSVKSRKDSLITFKNQKQLAQQIPQASHIYDIVYVIPRQVTKEMEKNMKSCKNGLIVQLGEGKTKIKANKVMLSSLRYLNDVTELLLKQTTNRKNQRYQIATSKLVQSNYCFSPNPKYFVPNCCHIPSLCTHHIPIQASFHQ